MDAQIDWSTISLTALKRLPAYTLPPSYHLSEHIGSHCAFDPPGYPTYFLRSVYTQHGNSPRNSAEEVIVAPGCGIRVLRDARDWKRKGFKNWEESQAYYEKLYRRLWLPLPIDHPRVRAWMAELYRHFQHCYYDHRVRPQVSERDKMFIWPIPNYKLKHFHDDPRFSEEWRRKEKAAVEQANREIIAQYENIVSDFGHMAVKRIREYYPDHLPISEWIANPPPHPGNWWETMAQPPQNAAECNASERHDWKHPINGSWCQWCGWREETGYAKPTE